METLRYIITSFAILMAIQMNAQTSETYVVKRGETFSSIASKYGISENELRKQNPDAKRCYTGMKLNIRKNLPFSSIHKNKETQSTGFVENPKKKISKNDDIDLMLFAASENPFFWVPDPGPDYKPNRISPFTICHRSTGKEYIRYIVNPSETNNKKYIAIRFSYELRENQKIYLRGKIIAISNVSRNDGHYLIAYKEETNILEYEKDYRLCYIPETFGSYLITFAQSGANDGAIGLVPLSEFDEYFGKNKVKLSPLISDRAKIKASNK